VRDGLRQAGSGARRVAALTWRRVGWRRRACGRFLHRKVVPDKSGLACHGASTASIHTAACSW
jgi:hypothetical protein